MTRVARPGAAAVFILTLSLPPALPAQTFRGGIQGTITDSTGAALGGAQVTVTNPAIGLTRTVQTGEDGQYVFVELPLGEYVVTATAPGFKSRNVTGVIVQVSAVRRVDASLEPGNVAERVDVEASLPLVVTTGNTMGGTIEGRTAVELPLNGRDFTKLLLLVPGSAGDPSGATDSPGSFGLFSVNGSRGRANNYLLDGTDMNDGYRNLPAINQAGVFGTPATLLPIDALAEIKVLSGTQVEYGRNSGAVVNIVTKSGTNDVHGSAYEYFRDDALNARNFFNAAPRPKDEFRNNQFGGSAGGPIVRDRTFWFGAYEGQRETVGIPSLSRVPSREALATATNPVIQRLVALNPWPAPNVPDAAEDEPNLQSTTMATNRVDSAIGKLDHNFPGGGVLTGRYFFGDSDQSFPLALLGGNVLPGYNTVTPTRVQIVSVSGVHVVSPRVLVEARGGYNRFDETFFPEDRGLDPSSIGLATIGSARDSGLPLIRVTGFAPIGANASLPRGRLDTNLHALLNATVTRGRHAMKAGYEFRRTTVDGFFDAGYRGVLGFNSLEDFLAGEVTGSSRQATGDSSRKTTQNSHSLYWQDGFSVSRKLTLDYGVRWDYMGVLGEDLDRLSILEPSAGLVQVGTGSLDRLYPRDWNNFAPRVSAVYDLTGRGRTVVRGSWGVFYDAFSQDFFVGQLPFNTFNPGPAYNGIGPSPILFSFSATPVLEAGVTVFDPSSFSAADVFTVDQDLETPYQHNYNVNIQHQIGSRTAVQAGYVGAIGRHLFRYRDVNQADPLTGERPLDQGPFAPDGSTFGYVNQFESTATSTYNAMQLSAEIRNWRGLSTRAQYTLSHSTDNASDGQDYVPNASQPDDSRNPEAERADSNFDARHRFTWFFTYEIPSGAQGGWLTSGWGINGVITLTTGMPFNVNYLFEGDFNGSGEFFGRPDLVGDPFAGTHTPERFLNLEAFAVPCTWDADAGDCVPGSGHFGNLGRNAFRGPNYQNVDLSIVKNNQVGPRVRLQLRLDIFNLFNRANFSNPLLPSFGVDFLGNGIDPATGRGVGFLPITATPDVGIGNPFLGGGGPRNMQFAARIMF